VGRRKSDVGCGMWEGGAGGCVGKAGAPSAPPTRFARHRSLEGGCRMGAGDGSALHGSRLEEHGPRVEDAARTVARQGNGESVGPWEVKARAASGRDLRLLRRLRGKTKDKSEWICSPPGKPGGKRPAPLRGCGEDTITRIIRSQPGKSGGKRPAPLRGCGEGTIARFICSPPGKPGGKRPAPLRGCGAGTITRIIRCPSRGTGCVSVPPRRHLYAPFGTSRRWVDVAAEGLSGDLREFDQVGFADGRGRG